jgi:hypothetical protein
VSPREAKSAGRDQRKAAGAHRDGDCVAVGALGLQVFLLQAEEVREDGGRQMRCAQAVLEAVVAGARKHQVRQPQLLQVAQALELRRVCARAPRQRALRRRAGPSSSRLPPRARRAHARARHGVAPMMSHARPDKKMWPCTGSLNTCAAPRSCQGL